MPFAITPDCRQAGRRWTERVFFRTDDGTVEQLSSSWGDDSPAALKLFVAAVRLLESKQLQIALRAALAERQEEAT